MWKCTDSAQRPGYHFDSPRVAGFLTATQAAAAGGITTLIDMPLNSSPCTTTSARLKAKIAASRVGVYISLSTDPLYHM